MKNESQPNPQRTSTALNEQIDAIVNAMLDAQAAGELNRLEQLRRLALHAGPAFDDAVQARLAQHERLLADLHLDAQQEAANPTSERIVSRVLARVRSEKNLASSPFPEVAQEASQKAIDAAQPLSRAGSRVQQFMQAQLQPTHALPDAQSQASSQASSPSIVHERPGENGQSGRAARLVHHKRRLFSSTALAFFAGGLVTLALVSVQLWFGARPATHPLPTQRPAQSSQQASQTPSAPRIPLTLDQLTDRAFFSPDQLPMISMPGEHTDAGVLRLGNAFGDHPMLWTHDLPGAMASSASSPSTLDMRAQLQMHAPATSAQLHTLDDAQRIARAALSPQQRAQAMQLLHWGMKPWQLGGQPIGHPTDEHLIAGSKTPVDAVPLTPLLPATPAPR